jgi:hypothetical protein
MFDEFLPVLKNCDDNYRLTIFKIDDDYLRAQNGGR